MGSISNGAPRSIMPGSLGRAEDIIASLGYDSIEFTDKGREVIATSYNAKGQKAQAIGRNREVAAQSLVRVLSR